MAELVAGDEPHGLRHRVEGDVLLVLDALPTHLHRELLVVRVAESLGAVVRQQEQDVLGQDTALLIDREEGGGGRGRRKMSTR